ncbi:hypothetical protein, partial [Nguyenibacter vanlangensis]
MKGKTRMSTSQKPARPVSAPDGVSRGATAQSGSISMCPVGFFPGLGSRAAYRQLERNLFDSDVRDVRQVFSEGAEALGSDPERLVLQEANIPDDRIERQAFLGAALLV